MLKYQCVDVASKVSSLLDFDALIRWHSDTEKGENDIITVAGVQIRYLQVDMGLSSMVGYRVLCTEKINVLKSLRKDSCVCSN